MEQEKFTAHNLEILIWTETLGLYNVESDREKHEFI